jgi:hypothetical protein
MNQPNPGDGDTIQLFEAAVQHLLPPYADEDDMYEALDKCGLTQRQIFDTLDRSFTPEQLELMNETVLSTVIIDIVYESFAEAIADVTAHKAPLQ